MQSVAMRRSMSRFSPDERSPRSFETGEKQVRMSLNELPNPGIVVRGSLLPVMIAYPMPKFFLNSWLRFS